jgi:hypothetical protein
MNLTGTSDLVQVTTSSAADIDVQASWVDQTTTAFTPGRTNTLITSATTTTVVGSPAGSTQRAVTSMKVRNAHAATANTVTIIHTDGTNAPEVWKGELLAGEAVQYDGKVFLKVDANGNTRTSTGITAAGLDTQIQYNDGGSTLAGDADLTWNKTTNTLGLSGTDTGLEFTNITTEPSAPASGVLRLYTKLVSGRSLPKFKGSGGLDTTFQPAFFGNNITMWNPTTATAGVWLGTAGAGAGTYATVLPTTTNLGTAMKRARWSNVVTTANQVLGQRNTEAMYFRGNATGQGGFFFFCRWRWETYTAGSRLFVGFHTATTVVSANPSAALNILGFGMDASDTDMTFMYNTNVGTATKDTITGLPSAASGQAFDSYIFCRPSDSTVYWRLVNITTGDEYTGSATTNLPIDSTMLTVGCLASNAALTVANNTQIGLNRIYVETDY